MLLAISYEAVIQYGLEHTMGRSLWIFYADNGILVSWDPDWIQVALNVFIVLFQRIKLAANITKLNTITCHPGSIILGILEEAFGSSSSVKG